MLRRDRGGNALPGTPVREHVIPCEKKVLSRILYSIKLKSDGINPNADGYKEMACAIADLIRQSSNY